LIAVFEVCGDLGNYKSICLLFNLQKAQKITTNYLVVVKSLQKALFYFVTIQPYQIEVEIL